MAPDVSEAPLPTLPLLAPGLTPGPAPDPARPTRAAGNPRASSSGPFAVFTQGLTKRFGQRVAVDRLDLAIPAGAISGFVGQNGAGKTTTIRMLLGLMRPSAGTGTVLGHSLAHPRRYLPRVGALIEGPTFYPTLTGRENLAVLARLGGLGMDPVDAALERVGLAKRARDPYRTYSLGMRQRLGIAAALLPSPDLLVLDEPTNGLDPHGIAEVRDLLRSFADEGMTVFVSSHLLGEIEQVCEHLVVIEDGHLLFQGTVGELLAARAPELVARTENHEDTARLVGLLRAGGRRAQVVPGPEGDSIQVVADHCFAAELNRMAMGAGITLTHLSARRGSLEEAFFEITGSCRRPGPPGHDAPGAAETTGTAGR